MQLVVWFSAVVCSSLAANLTATETTKDNEETTMNKAIPLEFPHYSQNYTFVDNSSIRENLANRTGNDTEVDDLLGKDTKETSEVSTTLSNLILANLPPNPSEEDEDIQSKNDTEWIENGNDTEDNKFETIGKEVDVSNETVLSYHQVDVPLFGGQVAAILAITFLVIAVFAYVGLLMWRRYLEAKYGSREMLVDEDDFIDPNDMKHFSI